MYFGNLNNKLTLPLSIFNTDSKRFELTYDLEHKYFLLGNATTLYIHLIKIYQLKEVI